MKTNGKHKLLGKIARRGLLLAALLALVLICATAGRAQSSATTASAQDVKLAATPAVASQSSTAVAKSETPPARAPELAQEKPPARGQQEGIKVHGHWTIEVRNPNGSIDKHVEFENGLCLSTGGGGFVAGNSGFSGGDFVIATILTNVLVPGGWEIFLGSPTIPTGSSPGPACSFTPAFTLVQSNSGLANGCQSPCFASLGAPTLNNNGGDNVITLTGQFTVPSGSGNTQITAVGTAIAFCSAILGSDTTGAACLANQGANPQITSVNFTGTYLTGASPIPPAITVSANQAVSVTVQISFQ
jgi:hypothetical protein